MADTPVWRPVPRSRVAAANVSRSPHRRLVPAAVVLGVLVTAALVVPLVVDLNQQYVDLASANRPPSAAHPFGTDELGRDVLLRCVYALRVSLRVRPGECVALVGESGCGKTVPANALLGFLPGNAQTSGTATLTGDGPPLDLLTTSDAVLATTVRGRRIGLIPQSPATHLTPVRTARAQLEEAVRVHHPADTAPHDHAQRVAARAGLAPDDLDRYPHELSGGMAQRVANALAGFVRQE